MSDTIWIVFRASNGKPGVEMRAFLPRGSTVLAGGFLSRESAVAKLGHYKECSIGNLLARWPGVKTEVQP